MLIEYGVGIAGGAGPARRPILQEALITWDRQQAAGVLSQPPETLNGDPRHIIRASRSPSENLGHTQRGPGQPGCVTIPEAWSREKGPSSATRNARSSINLGPADEDMPALGDFPGRALVPASASSCLEDHDILGLAQPARRSAPSPTSGSSTPGGPANRPSSKPATSLTPTTAYLQALDKFPSDAVSELAVTHHQLGSHLPRRRGHRCRPGPLPTVDPLRGAAGQPLRRRAEPPQRRLRSRRHWMEPGSSPLRQGRPQRDFEAIGPGAAANAVQGRKLNRYGRAGSTTVLTPVDAAWAAVGGPCGLVGLRGQDGTAGRLPALSRPGC